MLITLNPSATHPNKPHGFQHVLHSMPETNTYGGNSHLINHTYQ